MEYLCLLAEIETLKEENDLLRHKSRKVQATPKPVCSCMNMRGNPCKRKCLEGKTHCEKHDPSVYKKEKICPVMQVEPLVPTTDVKWVSEVEFWISRNEPRMV